MMMPFVPDLCVILDRETIGDRDPAALAALLLGAGVRWFQYRDKLSTDEAFDRELGRLIPVCRAAGARLIVNDRAGLASAADGVHLGNGDMPLSEARRLLGAGAIIGLTVRSPAAAALAEREGADYLGAGSVFPSATKGGIPVIGLGGLSAIVRGVRVPVVAVGGIGAATALAALEAGASGLAVVGAVLGAGDPASVARELLGIVRAFRTGRTA